MNNFQQEFRLHTLSANATGICPGGTIGTTETLKTTETIGTIETIIITELKNKNLSI